MNIPHYQDARVTLHHGDCLGVLRSLPDASVDAVVTDPPYGLSNTDPAHVADTIVRWVNGEREYLPPTKGGFMGKEWDSFVPPVAVWDECYRVLKPGGHVLAFAGSRTHDLMTLSIRLAGFEVRDSIAWLYGSGMPKSHDVSKAIDKAAGAEREVVGQAPSGIASTHSTFGDDNWKGIGQATYDLTVPATPDAEKWQGWGTALKPAFEPIVVARKPLSGTVAQTVLQHGTGALNIDGCRVATDDDTGRAQGTDIRGGNYVLGTTKSEFVSQAHPAGRWPANVVLDESQAEALDEQSGESVSRRSAGRQTAKQGTEAYGDFAGTDNEAGHNDAGGASRFFPTFRYQAKAPKSERPKVNGIAHNTVKPLTLMSWLVRLVTPPGGVVLEPFAGSGTTVEACIAEGVRCIAIEREAEYLPLIEARIRRQLPESL